MSSQYTIMIRDVVLNKDVEGFSNLQYDFGARQKSLKKRLSELFSVMKDSGFTIFPTYHSHVWLAMSANQLLVIAASDDNDERYPISRYLLASSGPVTLTTAEIDIIRKQVYSVLFRRMNGDRRKVDLAYKRLNEQLAKGVLTTVAQKQLVQDAVYGQIKHDEMLPFAQREADEHIASTLAWRLKMPQVPGLMTKFNVTDIRVERASRLGKDYLEAKLGAAPAIKAALEAAASKKSTRPVQLLTEAAEKLAVAIRLAGEWINQEIYANGYKTGATETWHKDQTDFLALVPQILSALVITANRLAHHDEEDQMWSDYDYFRAEDDHSRCRYAIDGLVRAFNDAQPFLRAYDSSLPTLAASAKQHFPLDSDCED